MSRDSSLCFKRGDATQYPFTSAPFTAAGKVPECFILKRGLLFLYPFIADGFCAVV